MENKTNESKKELGTSSGIDYLKAIDKKLEIISDNFTLKNCSIVNFFANYSVCRKVDIISEYNDYKNTPINILYPKFAKEEKASHLSIIFDYEVVGSMINTLEISSANIKVADRVVKLEVIKYPKVIYDVVNKRYSLDLYINDQYNYFNQEFVELEIDFITTSILNYKIKQHCVFNFDSFEYLAEGNEAMTLLLDPIEYTVKILKH